ncbi:SIR2 family protein [Halobacillus kuroshimensis]|uniref:SIR2 family protein n=1 Tax=Halobacillus kuroshimensis TaxID=302481 RepID=A0ABS3DTP0_9BACI|nr:SIR2 family protein [Halobacillus kuroshimensis]MBN8234724.1 SIR2 family protein [Halobacillus kuroshimensis]
MKRVVLTGNGLSVALNSDFGLQSITERFFDRLDDSHREFIKHHMKDKYSQLDFEEAIASIEQVFDSLEHYQKFLFSDNGNNFMNAYELSNKEFEAHLKAIQTIIHEYTSSILDLIINNVRQKDIEEKLQPFVDWSLETIDSSDEIDLFTLNFDLLLETILLTYYDKRNFADFHYRGKKWDAIDDEYQYYFDPDRSRQIHPENYTKNIRLHHLHGSLSSFKDLRSGRIFKITTDSLREHNLYENIFELGVIPSIVTGGGKSLKVQQNPFHYYYTEFKKKMVIDDELCDELYIIGYSFRDEHINKAIAERIVKERREDKPFNMVIVDYAKDDSTKLEFLQRVNKALKLGRKYAIELGDERVLFDGANSVKDLPINV